MRLILTELPLPLDSEGANLDVVSAEVRASGIEPEPADVLLLPELVALLLDPAYFPPTD